MRSASITTAQPTHTSTIRYPYRNAFTLNGPRGQTRNAFAATSASTGETISRKICSLREESDPMTPASATAPKALVIAAGGSLELSNEADSVSLRRETIQPMREPLPLKNPSFQNSINPASFAACDHRYLYCRRSNSALTTADTMSMIGMRRKLL